MPVVQKEGNKEAKFFPLLTVFFLLFFFLSLSLSLDEEELGAKLPCIMAHT